MGACSGNLKDFYSTGHTSLFKIKKKYIYIFALLLQKNVTEKKELEKERRNKGKEGMDKLRLTWSSWKTAGILRTSGCVLI